MFLPFQILLSLVIVISSILNSNVMYIYKILLTISILTILTNDAAKPLIRRTVVPTNTRADYAKYRLPGETIPSAYTIILKVDPNNHDSYDGQIIITISPVSDTRKIVLHSNVGPLLNINITDADDDSQDIYSDHSLEADDTHFLRVETTEDLVVGKNYVMKIAYIGLYSSNLRGFYLSSYKDSNNVDRYQAVTQFEALNARDAFPCYDEPGLKATFQINIYAPPDYHVLSNTDITTETDLPPELDGMTLHAFETSPKMSTYLVAFLVSDFIHRSNLDEDVQYFNKTVRIFARPNTEQYMDFALEYCQKTIRILEEYTDVTYAISKMDHAAIPKFLVGAMEHWGLVTYREPYLLYQPEEQTTWELQKIATVIAHEIGHMYFSNEVSPKWWDYLWLSEGFASYFEYYLPEIVEPEWRTMDQYVSLNLFQAMILDSLTITNPMTSSVASPQEINDNFNNIAYQKSGSVMRMVEHIIGTETFQQGIRNYLKSIPFGVGEPEILFEAFRKASEGKDIFPEGYTIVDFFENWSTQPGFPMVIAQKTTDRKSAILRQKRYYANTTLSSNQTWWIPINWVTSLNPNFIHTSAQTWLSPDQERITIPINLNSEDDWYILNLKVTGFYRIMYDEDNWSNLAKALKKSDFDGIHVINRMQLLNDALEYARTLKMSYRIAFDIMYYLRNELDFMPWLTVFPSLTTLNYLMPAADNYDLYREFVRQISEKAFQDLTLDTNINQDDYVRKMNRNYVTNIACSSGNDNCLRNAKEKLTDMMENPSIKLHPDVRSIIYCAGLSQADKNVWNFYWNKYLELTTSTEKTILLKGLACSEHVDIIQNFLAMVISYENDLDESVRYAIIEAVIDSGYIGVNEAVNFISNYFSDIQERIPSSTVRIIDVISEKIVTQDNVNQFIRFVLTYDMFTIEEKSAADSALLVIDSNRQWLEIVLTEIDPWLVENINL